MLAVVLHHISHGRRGLGIRERRALFRERPRQVGQGDERAVGGGLGDGRTVVTGHLIGLILRQPLVHPQRKVNHAVAQNPGDHRVSDLVGQHFLRERERSAGVHTYHVRSRRRRADRELARLQPSRADEAYVRGVDVERKGFAPRRLPAQVPGHPSEFVFGRVRHQLRQERVAGIVVHHEMRRAHH